MMQIEWKKFQNGSDIRGTAVDSGEEKAFLTPGTAAVIGREFTRWLSEKMEVESGSLRISVGRDSRVTGPELMAGFMSGIASLGAVPLDCGMASTPAMFMSTVIDEFSCHGAVMITASHLPWNRNGFKFFTSEGGLEKTDIAAILDMASSSPEPPVLSELSAARIPLIDRYSEIFVSRIRQGIDRRDSRERPLEGLRIIVDAGNGAGGFFVSKVLEPLGADTSGSLFLEPDGMFPNHEPNPENSKAMETIRDAVLKEGADLGIIFDTDVDRAAVVSSTGEIINRNSLIALMSAIVLEEHPGSVIVTDSVTSDGLADFIEDDLKGEHHRFKRGYKNVINEALRLNSEGKECHLAIETSGHGAMKENYFLDDGAYLVAKILIKMGRMKFREGKDLLEVLAGLKQPAEAEEFRISLLQDDFKEQGRLIIEGLEKYVSEVPGWQKAPVNHEGVRVSWCSESGKGWFLLRLSLHDPVLPLNLESEISGGAGIMAEKICRYLETLPDIDYEKIKKYISSQAGRQ